MQKFVGQLDRFVIEATYVIADVAEPLFDHFRVFAMDDPRTGAIHRSDFETVRPAKSVRKLPNPEAFVS